MIQRCLLYKCELLDSDFCETCKSKTKEIKTKANWNGYLNEYLKIGDVVDEEMVDYFINVLPPLTMTGELIQMSEPYDHINGRGIYSTLVKTEDGWTYAGHCHKNSWEHKKGYYELMMEGKNE